MEKTGQREHEKTGGPKLDPGIVVIGVVGTVGYVGLAMFFLWLDSPFMAFVWMVGATINAHGFQGWLKRQRELAAENAKNTEREK